MTGECPFCGRVMNARYVPKHVLNNHQGTFVGEHMLMAFAGVHGGAGYLCWCRRSFGGPGSLLDHWKQRGGVLAHILEISLGGNDGR